MSAITVHTPQALLDGVSNEPSPESAIPLDSVRAELRRITASAGFTATDRSRKLLDYLVNETLAGRAARIKAYCIGTEVFGRPESFDPQKDPIVRIEAARLRRELEHYYLTEGIGDSVVIDIPKGAYVPRFRPRQSPLPSAAAATTRPDAAGAGRWSGRIVPGTIISGILLLLLALVFNFAGAARPTADTESVQIPGLLVKPLADLTNSRNSAVLAQGLTERIIEKTSRFKELAVIPGDSGTVQTPTSLARYEFGGTLRDDGSELVVQTRLVDRMDGRVIWAESFNVALRPQQLFEIERTIADQIATRLAEPSGILFEAERRAWLEAPPDSLNAYLCTLSAYAYRATFATGKFEAVRACLQKAVAEHPDYATAWALLSLAYIDEYRFFYAPPQGSTTLALDRAYDAARRATELDPANVRAQQALMMALFFRKEHQAALDVGARALTINPNDVELKGEYGYRLALSGNWEQGCRLVQEAIDSSARKIAYHKVVLALCAFYRNDPAAAATLIAEADARDNPAYHVIAAAILAEAGDAAAAKQQRQWLEQNSPRQMAQFVAELPQRLVRPIDRQRFSDALRKAGFSVAE